MRPNQQLTKLWTNAANLYWENFLGSPAEDYMRSRGLDLSKQETLDLAERFRIGYVSEPAAGHDDRFKGMLSIPYITPAGVIGFKFRRLDGGDPKYMIPTGQKQHLYNVRAILEAVDRVMIVEGELDALAASMVGIPAVAVAGVNAWKPYFARCFDGIAKVVICTDNDAKEDGSNPGQDLARKLVETLPQAVRVSLPHGEDVNSTLQNYGSEYLQDLVGAV